jgi:hypothetical protein
MRFRKKIFEAIVAVPFWIEDGERKFFKTWDPKAAVTPSVAGETYAKQVELMQKYVFPPAFDFINGAISGTEGQIPIAMYVFEFSHTLDQDDLSHIWQNLPPKLGTKPQVSTSTIRHKLLANEIFGDKEIAVEASRTGRPTPYTGIGEKIQWMVFKVKQRAKRDYFTEIDGRKPAMPFYTYNWPYDYFSFVEMAQLEAEFRFKPIPRSERAGLLELNLPKEQRWASRGASGERQRLEKVERPRVPYRPGVPGMSGDDTNLDPTSAKGGKSKKKRVVEDAAQADLQDLLGLGGKKGPKR